MNWLKRKSSHSTSSEPTLALTEQPLAALVRLDERSRFSYVESLEFWPELDDDSGSFAVRSAYPGEELGVVRGEQGEYMTGMGVVRHFKMNRRIGAACWASAPRYEGREVHDLGWTSLDENGVVTLNGSALSIDLSPDGRVIAHLSWVDGQARLTLVKLRSGLGTELATFTRDQATGGEMIRWSPDSRLVLMSGNPTRSPFLIEASTGRMVALPWPGQASWWPGFSFPTLVLLESRAESTLLSRVNLAAATRDLIGTMEAPPEMPRQGSSVSVFGLDVAPDGRSFVGHTFFGAVSQLGTVSAGGREKWVHGTLPRNPGDGPPRVLRWSPEWCWRETPSLELVHRDIRYTEVFPSGPMEVNRSLFP